MLSSNAAARMTVVLKYRDSKQSSMLADREDIEAFADEVRDELGDRVEQILLFGSYATEEYVPGSDVDIAVLLSDEHEGDEEAVWDIAERFHAEHGIRFVPKLFEADVFRERVDQEFSFYTTVDEQGVPV